MKRIFYAGGSALTTDSLADAVLDYAEALAKSPQAADVVKIPIVLDSGHAGIATMLVGPASQLFTVSEDAELLTVPDDAEIVDELRKRSLRVGSPRPVTQGDSEPVAVLHLQDEFE